MPKANDILQFRIALRYVEPEVWRRIQVPATYSFWDLHVAIVDSLGWLDYHLHAFRFPDREEMTAEIGIPVEDLPMEDGGMEVIPGWEIPVTDYLGNPGDAVEYEYDFGDGWVHTIVLEDILERDDAVVYPCCIDGAQPCPPEDCGGPPGYERLLEILRDPGNEEYEEMREWSSSDITRYPPFEPGVFDIARIRFDDPRERWEFAFSDEPSESFASGTAASPGENDDSFRRYSAVEEILWAFEHGEGYQREAVDRAIEMREDITGYLLQILEDVRDFPEEFIDEPEGAEELYALLLLGYFGERKAHAILLEMLRLPDEDLDELWGDIFTVDMPMVLLNTSGGDIEGIQELSKDRTTNLYSRMAGVEALVYGVVDGTFDRDTVLSFLCTLLDGVEPDDLPDEELEFTSLLAASIMDLHPAEYRETIDRAFDRGLILPRVVTRSDFDREMDEPREAALERLRASYSTYALDDIHHALRKWLDQDELYRESPAPHESGSHSGTKPKSKKNKSKRKQAKASRKKNRKK